MKQITRRRKFPVNQNSRRLFFYFFISAVAPKRLHLALPLGSQSRPCFAFLRSSHLFKVPTFKCLADPLSSSAFTMSLIDAIWQRGPPSPPGGTRRLFDWNIIKKKKINSTAKWRNLKRIPVRSATDSFLRRFVSGSPLRVNRWRSGAGSGEYRSCTWPSIHQENHEPGAQKMGQSTDKDRRLRVLFIFFFISTNLHTIRPTLSPNYAQTVREPSSTSMGVGRYLTRLLTRLQFQLNLNLKKKYFVEMEFQFGPSTK